MKKASCLVFLVCSVLFLQSCKKTANNAINCIGEAFYVNVNFTVDPSNSKTINFTATDSGEYPLKSVQWIYGDGSTATTTTLTSSHTYSSAGTYTVTANVNVSTCTIKPQKAVKVN